MPTLNRNLLVSGNLKKLLYFSRDTHRKPEIKHHISIEHNSLFYYLLSWFCPVCMYLLICRLKRFVFAFHFISTCIVIITHIPTYKYMYRLPCFWFSYSSLHRIQSSTDRKCVFFKSIVCCSLGLDSSSVKLEWIKLQLSTSGEVNHCNTQNLLLVFYFERFCF